MARLLRVGGEWCDGDLGREMLLNAKPPSRGASSKTRQKEGAKSALTKCSLNCATFSGGVDKSAEGDVRC